MLNRRVWADIDLDAMTRNLNRVRALAGEGKGIMAIVKANAYGHGAVPVAWHLAAQGVEALGVGDSEEAIELRQAGISIPIVILGSIVGGELPAVIENDIAVTVHSAERARLLEREGRRASHPVAVHLKVDTGLGRLGCAPSRAREIARLIHQSEFLRFEGLSTHFAAAGPGDDAFTRRQLALFEQVSRRIADAGIPLPPRHAAASSAILSRVAGHLDMVRPGLALYGLGPTPGLGEGLSPVLSLRTQVIFLKDHAAGRSIGYAREHVTPRRTRIATLPVGYNDGYPFRLSGKGEVLIRGQRAPVVGRVSMDYMMVDVGPIAGVCSGDEVVLIGGSGDESVTARELAERSGTIVYEILTGIGKRVGRVYLAPESGQPRGFSVVRRPAAADETAVRR